MFWPCVTVSVLALCRVVLRHEERKRHEELDSLCASLVYANKASQSFVCTLYTGVRNASVMSLFGILLCVLVVQARGTQTSRGVPV